MTPKAAAALERVQKFAEAWKKSGIKLHPAEESFLIGTDGTDGSYLCIADLLLVLKLATNCNVLITGPHPTRT